MQAKGLILKLTTSHFNALNNKITNQNMLERILIAMQDEINAMFRGSHRLPVQVVDIIRPVGTELFQLQF